ncbi:MAG: NAD(P)H-hydrate epimerase [Ornithinimicrobium sp.]
MRRTALDTYPLVPADDIAWITEADMVEVDRVMIEDLHIELLQMMENAGRNLARLVLDLASPHRVAVAAGSGGNGGGGLVAARHLANSGVEVIVTTTSPHGELSPGAAHQLDILHRMGVSTSETVADCDIAIDTVIGYSLRGTPHGRSASLIEQLNAIATVVALDTPSGLDVTSGRVPGTAARAHATMTLALPKIGLRKSEIVGDLYLADISVPPSATAGYGSTPDFSTSSLLRIAR